MAPARRTSTWQDGLGSTTQLANTSGAVTDSYTYDAFGAITSHTGTSPQPFTFTGQQQDTNAARGLLYLRARSYDPGLGRFVSQDPLPFLQHYAYAGDDPANLIDATGLCGGSWNPLKYTDCATKFIRKHPGLQRDVVLGADVAAIGFTGASATITDIASVAGCWFGPEGCVAGYGLGITATSGFRLVGNAASDVSTTVGCVKGKEGNSRFAKNCGVSVTSSFLGATFRDPNVGVALDVNQFCRDRGGCDWP